MNISMGAASSHHPINLNAGPKSEKNISNNTDQQIKVLEEEKSQLERQRDEAKNPFAERQSDQYASLGKRIQDLDKQIQQLKSESSSTDQAKDTQNADSNSANRSFDTYISSKGQSEESAGLY